MDPAVLTVLLVVLLIAFLGSGVWVALSLFGVAAVAVATFTPAPVGQLIAVTVWGAGNSWELAALPMFIWMGEILFRSRLSRDLFTGLSPWVAGLPGGLLHVNILGCGLFAAVSGSSAATTATVGRLSLSELGRRGYDEDMTIGTLAGSGTFGLLIPPSIILIVYGVGTDQSIVRLFIAGVVPGLLVIALFMGYVIAWSLLGGGRGAPSATESTGLGGRLRAARNLIPVVALIAGVIGAIYTGFASPTEAAAVGVVLSLALSWLTGSMSRRVFVDALMGATRTSCMIAFILCGAAFLAVSMGFVGIPRQLAEWIVSMGLSPALMLMALTVFFVILGCFLDGISVVVLTTSVILPMVEAAGIDLIWFGIYLVLVVEMSQVTPPVGFNLFVLQSLTGRDIMAVARCALPFFLLLAVAVLLIALFPDIVTWLPGRMAG